jgi:Phosphodiester glycosidase
VRKLSGFLAFLFVVGTVARAEWHIISSNSEASPHPGIEHRHLELRNFENEEAMIDCAVFSAKAAALRVIDNPEGKNLADVLASTNCIAAVNGGYFDPQFKPIGLRIIDGATTTPLKGARLLTGVFCASPRGIEIVRVGEFSRRRKYDAAVECGPFLIDVGTRVRSLDDKRSARRTFAAVARGESAAIGCTSELTLAQLAGVLSTVKLGESKIWRAMNLDGGSSTAFCFKRADGNPFSIAEQKRVRDFLAIASR